MRRPAASFLTLALVGALTTGALPCGAMPQEGKAQRPAPSPRSPEGPASLPAPQMRRPMKSDFESVRTPRPQGDSPSRPTTDPVRNTTKSIRVRHYPDTNVVVPRPWQRCGYLPDHHYWGSRDLMAEIQWMSRSGTIPVTALSDGVDSVNDYSLQPAGWRAYGIAVPAGATVQVEVKHTKLGWFRLMLVDKWGKPGPGMLQAAIAHQPIMVTYKNPGTEATAIYVIVDDPAWWSSSQDPYTLQVRRDWDPTKTDLSQVKMVVGLWGATPSVSAQYRHPTLTGPAVYPR